MSPTYSNTFGVENLKHDMTEDSKQELILIEQEMKDLTLDWVEGNITDIEYSEQQTRLAKFRHCILISNE